MILSSLTWFVVKPSLLPCSFRPIWVGIRNMVPGMVSQLEGFILHMETVYEVSRLLSRDRPSVFRWAQRAIFSGKVCVSVCVCWILDRESWLNSAGCNVRKCDSLQALWPAGLKQNLSRAAQFPGITPDSQGITPCSSTLSHLHTRGVTPSRPQGLSSSHYEARFWCLKSQMNRTPVDPDRKQRMFWVKQFWDLVWTSE